MRSLKVIVFCEESQVVTKAFRRLGHEAYSCDLQECSGGHPEWHIKGDARDVDPKQFDLAICHPVCTRMANSGALRLYVGGKKENGIDPVKWKELVEGTQFFKYFLNLGIPTVVENPVMHGHAKKLVGRSQDQIIQPYQFGDDASKATCLWLIDLPLLKPTKYFPPRIVDGKPRWGNQTDSGQNKLAPTPDRAKKRSVTYTGIADAMAEQWSQYLIWKKK